MNIQAELTIDPAVGTLAARYTLSVGIEVVFQKYEHDMTPTEREIVSLLTWGNGRQMDRISVRLRTNNN